MLENLIKMNRVFTNMVIRDLKYPTQGTIQTLKDMDHKLLSFY